ncbi:MAG: hypothetical protein AAF411_22530, partial [Myxococcota bacterium]
MKLVFTYENSLPNDQADAEVVVNTAAAFARRGHEVVLLWAYARRLLSPVGVVFVSVATTILIILAAIGATRFTMDFEYRWLFSDSLDYDWVPVATDFQLKWFPDSGAGEDSSPQLPFYTKKADYFEEKEAVYNLIDTYSQLSYVQMNTEDNWFVAHEAWSNNVTSSE